MYGYMKIKKMFFIFADIKLFIYLQRNKTIVFLIKYVLGRLLKCGRFATR